MASTSAYHIAGLLEKMDSPDKVCPCLRIVLLFAFTISGFHIPIPLRSFLFFKKMISGFPFYGHQRSYYGVAEEQSETGRGFGEKGAYSECTGQFTDIFLRIGHYE